MLLVPNHKVIVPKTYDISFTVDEIKSSVEDIIYIELFGDSIMCGRDPDLLPPQGGVCSNNDIITGRVVQPPSDLLPLFLPQYRMVVTTRSVGGSTSGNLLLGTDGANGVWPDNIEANIIVINHGLNDAKENVNVADYKNNLIELRDKINSDQIMVWQTPTVNYYYDVAPYAQAMKEVAAMYNDIVADTGLFSNWLGELPDGIHPRQLGYSRLIDRIVAPAINLAILQLLKNKTNSIYRKEYRQIFDLDNQQEITLNFTPISSNWVEIYYRDSIIYQVAAKGYNDNYGKAAGLYNYRTGDLIAPAGRSYNLIKIKRENGKIVGLKTFDIFGDPSQAQALANALNETNHDHIVIVYTYDEPKSNRLTTNLRNAMYRCGASQEIFNSSEFKFRSAYVLVGIPGVGMGNGYEAYSGDYDNHTISYSEIVFELTSQAEPSPIDIFPPYAKTQDSQNIEVRLSNFNYKIVKPQPPVNGTRILNGRYTTQFGQGVAYDSYNIIGNKVFFEKPITGIITVVCDSVNYITPNAHAISLSNIHSYDYFTHRFHHLRWARGNTNTTLGLTASGPLSPVKADGVDDTNNLNIINTYVNMRVGDSFYGEPVVLTQPKLGYVRMSLDRKQLVYVPFPNTTGLDSFSYTIMTQRGQMGLPASAYVEIIPGPADATYQLSTNKTLVSEGNTVTISLTTTNLANGSNVAYRVSGVSPADFGYLNTSYFQGNFTITNGNSSVTFGPVADRTTEGNEIFTLSLVGPIIPPKRISVTVGDTSRTPEFNLRANVASISESGAVEFTLTTSNLEDGYIVPYSISGISTADIFEGLSGTFIINNNAAQANVTIRTKEDEVTEGNELIYFSLSNVQPTVAATVTILDTSGTKAYALSSNVSSVNEGQSVEFILTTQNVKNGSVVPYTISGVNLANDLVGVGSSSGSFTVSSNTASAIFKISADRVTETTETLTLTLTGLTFNGSPISHQVLILDTSKNPTYAITSNVTTIDEGDSVQFTLTTTEVDDGTIVPFNINPVSVPGKQNVFSAYPDLVGIPSGTSSGSFTVYNNTGTVTYTASRDKQTETFFDQYTQVFRLDLVNVPSVYSPSITINDTSRDPTYTLTANVSVVNEGNAVEFTLTTTEVDDGTLVPYQISTPTSTFANNDDFDNLITPDYFVINNGTATKILTIKADRLTDNNEILRMLIVVNGVTKTSIDITVVDTSLSPSYSITKSSDRIREGVPVTFTVNTVSVDDGTILRGKIYYSEENEISSRRWLTANDLLQPVVNPTTLEFDFPPLVNGSAQVNLELDINSNAPIFKPGFPAQSSTMGIRLIFPGVSSPPFVLSSAPIQKTYLCNDLVTSTNQFTFSLWVGTRTGIISFIVDASGVADQVIISWNGQIKINQSVAYVQTLFFNKTAAYPEYVDVTLKPPFGGISSVNIRLVC